MYTTGQKVKIKIADKGMRTEIINREALNAYWVSYNDKEYFVSKVFLDRWNRSK